MWQEFIFWTANLMSKKKGLCNFKFKLIFLFFKNSQSKVEMLLCGKGSTLILFPLVSFFFILFWYK